jgi:hypothetical protein
MATRKTTRTARKAAKKTTARKAPAKKAAAKRAASKAPKKAARKAVKKAVVKKAVKKAAVKKAAVKKAVRKAAVKKAVKKAAVRKAVKKAVVRKAVKKAVVRKAVKKAVVRKTVKQAAATKASAPAQRRVGPGEASKMELAKAPTAMPRGGRSASRSRKPHRITPEEALANTRELLEAKQARDREPPPWRQFDPDHGHPAHEHGTPGPDAAQQAQAHAHAEELHRGESRIKAIQGSISGQDRHHQGRQDAKD